MITINSVGEITKKVVLNNEATKKLLKQMVAGESGEYTGEWIHSRWSVLYNAYDMMHLVNIRAEHDGFLYSSGKKVSRLDFMVSTGRIQDLLVIATYLYPQEFQKYVLEVI